MVCIRKYINDKIMTLSIAFMMLFIKIGNVFGSECITEAPSEIILRYSRRGENCSWDTQQSWVDGHPDCFWFSAPLRSLFHSMEDIGTDVYERLAGIHGYPSFAIPLLSVCFALWLAYQVMKYVSALYAQSPADFAVVISTGLFKLCVAAALIRWGAGDIFEHFVGVFVVSAANVGTELINSISVDNLEPVTESTVAVTPIMAVARAVHNNTVAVARIFMEVVGYGKVLFDFSFEDGLFCVLPSIEPFITGIVLMVTGIVFVCMIPLKFIDAIFRLTIVYSFMPLLIVAWVFPSTKKYTMKAWNMVIYSVFLFLVMSLLFALCATMLGGYLISGNGDANALSTAKNVFSTFQLEGEENKHTFLSIVVMICISVKILGSGKEIVSHFSDATDGGIAESALGRAGAVVGGTAAGVAMAIPQGFVEDGARKAGDLIAAGAGKASKAIGGGIASVGRRLSQKPDLEVSPEQFGDSKDKNSNVFDKLNNIDNSSNTSDNYQTGLIVDADDTTVISDANTLDAFANNDKNREDNFEGIVNQKLDDAQKKSSDINDEMLTNLDSSKIKDSVSDEQNKVMENARLSAYMNKGQTEEGYASQGYNQDKQGVQGEKSNLSKDKVGKNEVELSKEEVEKLKEQVNGLLSEGQKPKSIGGDNALKNARDTVVDETGMKRLEMEKELAFYKSKENMSLSRIDQITKENEELREKIILLSKESGSEKQEEPKSENSSPKMSRFKNESKEDASIAKQKDGEEKFRTIEEVEEELKKESGDGDKNVLDKENSQNNEKLNEKDFKKNDEDN